MDRAVEGRFYRDLNKDIWQAVTPEVLLFVADGTEDPDIIPNDFVPLDRVAADYGPLVEVRPVGWEEV